MALQGPFFGKRDSGGLNPGMKPAGSSSLGSAAPGAQQPFGAAPMSSSMPGSQRSDGMAQLTVGRNIKLKGVEITDCDTLVVEGEVEATMKSRLVQITNDGSFKGTVEVDVAEVHGVFDGDLTVKQKLVIYASGKVTGKIRYGKIVIEEGGQISGDVAWAGGAADVSRSGQRSN